MRRACCIVCIATLAVLSQGCSGAGAVAAKKLAPVVAQALLGPGFELFWTRDGSKPRNVDLVKQRLAVLETELGKIDAEYAESVRNLRENLSAKTSLAEYRAFAKDTITRIEELEARVSKLEKRADETDRKITEFEKRLKGLETGK